MKRCGTTSPKQSQAGFSMTEVVVVLVVLAILAAIAVPSIMRYVQVYRLDTSVSIISNKLMESRMNAIKRNRTSMLHVDLTSRTAQVKSTNDAGQTIDVGFPAHFPQNVRLDAADSVSISFDSMGRLAAGARTITVFESGSGKRKNISVSPAGKVTVGPMY